MSEFETDLFADLTDLPEPTKVQSGEIKPIGEDAVHKICSGQVVLSLAVAVKELVENSIDAGATLVEVKLKNRGLDSLEVSDNGCGVEEQNLIAMTAKYHTSKIREFIDLQNVETFGFRGEALSSLCALADMTILTRHRTTDVATKIELDHKGNIVKRTPCARSVGTTVILTNLFGTLPVRQRDFTRNIKKEFTKMCQILQAYCLVATQVRIICSNQTPNAGKVVVMQTHGAKNVLANVTAIFGARQATELIELKSPVADNELNAENLLQEMQNNLDDSINITIEDVKQLNGKPFDLEGFISSCSHGAGRSSKDRQFFYVNSRPCDPKNISKVMNDVYHRFNVSQYPFIYLNVKTARPDVDVNLTPDKRQLLVHNEKILLLAIKKSLLNTFGNIPATYKMQNSNIKNMLGIKTEIEIKSELDIKIANIANFERINSNEIDATTNGNGIAKQRLDETLDLVELPKSTTQGFRDVLSQWKNTGYTVGTAPHVRAKRKCPDEIEVRKLKMKKMQEFLKRETKQIGVEIASLRYNSESSESQDEGESEDNDDRKSKSAKTKLNDSLLNLEQMKKESTEYDDLTTKKTDDKKLDDVSDETAVANVIVCKVKTPKKSENELKFFTKHVEKILQKSPPKTIQLDDYECDINAQESLDNFTYAELNTSLGEIAFNLKAEDNLNDEHFKLNLKRLRFKSVISPSQNQNAEDELQREIAKDDFKRMEIIGQFNLGFIIVKLDSDLFIVDQHATDEKYNFEMLQRTTVLQNQKLTVPQLLEMTAVNEMVLLDHLDVFEKNGFKFDINENAPVTKKIRLVAKPFSKNWEFGKDDIDELIFMLQDAPDGTECRPSRIRAMFASRACRKSVMIGKALNKSAMKTLITQMGEIEQPWNCPHGRPTMRHLINTDMLLDNDDAVEIMLNKEKSV